MQENRVFSEDVLVDSIRREGFNISESELGGFRVNSIPVPHSYMPWLFRTWGRYDATNKVYRLSVNGAAYTFRSDNSLSEYRKNGVLHCTSGPASSHNGVGTYYLNGFKVASLPSLDERNKIAEIRSSPESFISLLYHRDMNVTQYRLKDHILVDIDDHTFLLKERNDSSAEEHIADLKRVFLEGLYKPFSGYDVISYSTKNADFRRIFAELESLSKFDSYTSTNAVDIDGKKKDGSFLSVTFDKKDKKLLASRYSPEFILSGSESIDMYAYDSTSFITSWSDNALTAQNQWITTASNSSFDDELDRLLKDLEFKYGDELLQPSGTVTVYHGGHVISDSVLTKSNFDPETDTYYWVDEDGLYHSPGYDLPSAICGDGEAQHHYHGVLHRENGPAIYNSNKESSAEYWIMGRPSSLDEMIHYRPKSRRIEFRKDGVLHRTDGPAVVLFNEDENTYIEEFWVHGKKVEEPYAQEGESEMTEEKDKEDSRLSQLYQGGKLGLKKGVVNGATELAAEKIVSSLSIEDKEWTKEFTKIVLTGGTAELIDILPDDSLEKVRISADRKEEITYFLRNLTGENIGRNIVMLLPKIMSGFKELLSFSAEEIEEGAESLEESNIPWEATVFSDEDVEDVSETKVEEVKEHVYVK